MGRMTVRSFGWLDYVMLCLKLWPGGRGSSGSDACISRSTPRLCSGAGRPAARD